MVSEALIQSLVRARYAHACCWAFDISAGATEDLLLAYEFHSGTVAREHRGRLRIL